jgi:alkylation response protein AidB-like acyl-CoA dehydrogenase
MALGLSEEHLELAVAVRGWAERSCPVAEVRAAAGSPDGGAQHYRESLGPSLAAQGVLGLHLPECHGGQGYGLPELAVALEELGRALVPGAFLPTILASAVLDSAVADGNGAVDGRGGGATGGASATGGADRTGGASATGGADRTGGAGGTGSGGGGVAVRGGALGKLISGLADGSLTGAVALAAGLTGRAGDDGALIVSGEAGPVLGGSQADLIIAGVTTEHGEIWAAIDATSLHITELGSLDLTRPLATVRADGVALPSGRLLTGLGRADVASLAAIAFGAEACGIADWATWAAAGYAQIRHQFGRPIGQFQAVKHRCAWMLTEAEQAAAVVWEAARSGPDERDFAAGVAAVVAIDAAVRCANDCIQVLGGIGYTWEHEAHLYYRRAMSLRALLGPADQWARQTAEWALAGARNPVKMEFPGGDETARAAIRSELAQVAALSGAAQVRALAAGGWVLPHLPRPWGRGASPVEQLIIDEELRAAKLRPPGLAIGAWVAPALIQYGTRAQQERFLPPTLRADYLWCQLFSEPGAGSDLAGLTTRATKADGGWRITGQKIWTSLAREAAWAICIARTNPAEPRHDGISYFLVDMKAPGIQVRPLREITGDSFFNEVFLDEVFVPDECVVGEINGGWRIARTTLANERVSLSRSWAFGSGVDELLDTARAAGAGAGAGGGPVPLGDIGALVSQGQALEALAARVTMKQLSGTEPGATGSVRKLLGMRYAQRVAELCWSMSGTSGALGRGHAAAQPGGPDGAGWAHKVLQNRALTIGGGTTDIQLNIIGERILALPRDPDPPAA